MSLYQPNTDDGASSSIGVVYRFARHDSPISITDLQHRDYYNAPGTLVCHEFLRIFEADVTLEESWDTLRYAYELFRVTGDRPFDIIKLPRGIVDASRVGRQSAAVVIPDEIQLFSEKHPDKHRTIVRGIAASH